MADTSITEEWLRVYEGTFNAQDTLSSYYSHDVLSSDATIVATSLNTIDHSPTNSTTNTTTSPAPSSGPATPNNHKPTCFSKPIRRASKKTPTTHLNADASNFRALVQKFTGFHHHKKSISFRNPINLNFKLGRVQTHKMTYSSSKCNNIIFSPFGDNYHQLMYVQEQPQMMGEQPRHLQALSQDKNDHTASNLSDENDHQEVENNIDNSSIPNNLKLFEDNDHDGFLWDDLDLREYPILEETFSSEIADCCYV